MNLGSKKLIALGALVVVAIAVAVGIAVGDGSDKEVAQGNATDAAFIKDMTAHHEGAIEMAELAQSRAEHAEVRQLADAIVAAQKEEIAKMSAIADDLEAQGINAGTMGMSESAMGMGMDMDELANADPFDRAFIDAMIPHHEGAIAMAKMELADGSSPALKSIAEDIGAAQTREIADMQGWREEWYGARLDAGASSATPSHGSMGH